MNSTNACSNILSGLTLELQSGAGKVAAANLTNITDKLYADALYRGHYIPGAGRLLQVSLSARF